MNFEEWFALALLALAIVAGLLGIHAGPAPLI